jgi:hypothetical protein
MNITYKRAHFQGCMPNNSLNVVSYVMYSGKQIVFTGLHNTTEGPAGSSINFAEDIIAVIAKKENINPQGYTFYDLQTPKGYPSHEPGDYSFNKLRPQWKNGVIVQMGWQEGHCSDIILEHFGGYIRGSDHRITFRNLPQAYGAIKPLPKNYHPNTFQDMIELTVLAHDICKEHGLDGLLKTFLERIAETAKGLCNEQGVNPNDSNRFLALPRNTPLGQTSSKLFNGVCDWLKEQHVEFERSISPVLFFVV